MDKLWNTQTKQYYPALKRNELQHHSLSEKCKSKPQRGTMSCGSEWLPSKSLQTINAGEGVEKKEPSYTVGVNAN